MGFSSRIIIFIWFILTQVIAKDRSKLAIIGGDDAPQNSYTYTVSLQNSVEHICGGGIIGDKFILTAAHCVIDDKGIFEQTMLTAVIGAVDILNMPQSTMRIQTETIYAHVKYNPEVEDDDPTHRTEGDIAVLKLRESIGLQNQPHLMKLELPRRSSLRMEGREAIITGYGFNVMRIVTKADSDEEMEQGESFGKMRYAKTTIIPKATCTIMPREIHDSNICAQLEQREDDVPEGVCSGDSGGPLVWNGNVIIGVLSSSPFGCSEEEGMGVYTRITSYKTFIKDSMNGKKSSDIRVANWYFFNEICSNLEPRLIEKRDIHNLANSNEEETVAEGVKKRRIDS